MNPLLAEGLVAMFLAALSGCFGLAFATPLDAERAVARIRVRQGVFRAGVFAIGGGIVFTFQADAIAKLNGIPADDPGSMSARTAGWLLIVVGVAILDLVLWWPRTPAPVAAPQQV